jgi:hypothetical protein
MVWKSAKPPTLSLREKQILETRRIPRTDRPLQPASQGKPQPSLYGQSADLAETWHDAVVSRYRVLYPG